MTDSRNQADLTTAALAKAFAQTALPESNTQMTDGSSQAANDWLRRIIDDLRGARTQAHTPTPNDMPSAAGTHLDRLVDSMPASPLAKAVRPLLDRLVWYRIFEDERIDASLADGLNAAQIVGRRGILSCEGPFMGLFLLAPRIVYPLHQHSALEIYHVLSGEVSIRHGRTRPAQRIVAGRHSITPPHQVHELSTDDTPCLIAYVWTGEIDDENWWWQCGGDGVWERVCWKRQSDSSWRIDRREPLDSAEVRRAGDG